MSSPISPANPLAGILGAKRAVTKVVTENPLVQGAEAANTALDAIASARRWTSDRHNWIRVIWFGSGVVLILGGLVLLAKPAVSGVIGSAVDVLPVGKVVKKVTGGK